MLHADTLQTCLTAWGEFESVAAVYGRRQRCTRRALHTTDASRNGWAKKVALCVATARVRSEAGVHGVHVGN